MKQFIRSTSSFAKYIHAAKRWRSTYKPMKKFFTALVVFSLAVAAAKGTEQDIVNRSAGIIREFRHMPEKGLPPRIIRNAKGLAILSVGKAGFIFSGKAGEGVVIARTRHGWCGPSIT